MLIIVGIKWNNCTNWVATEYIPTSPLVANLFKKNTSALMKIEIDRLLNSSGNEIRNIWVNLWNEKFSLIFDFLLNCTNNPIALKNASIEVKI